MHVLVGALVRPSACPPHVCLTHTQVPKVPKVCLSIASGLPVHHISACTPLRLPNARAGAQGAEGAERGGALHRRQPRHPHPPAPGHSELWKLGQQQSNSHKVSSTPAVPPTPSRSWAQRVVKTGQQVGAHTRLGRDCTACVRWAQCLHCMGALPALSSPHVRPRAGACTHAPYRSPHSCWTAMPTWMWSATRDTGSASSAW